MSGMPVVRIRWPEENDLWALKSGGDMGGRGIDPDKKRSFTNQRCCQEKVEATGYIRYRRLGTEKVFDRLDMPGFFGICAAGDDCRKL